MTLHRWLLLALAMAAAWSTAADEDGVAADYRTVVVAEPLEWPWGLAFLPDGGLLVSERPGRLRRVSPDGVIGEPLRGVPAVYFRGQGGLLDVALHPDFADNRLVYVSYAHGDARRNATRVARAVLTDAGLDDLEVIFTAEPPKDTPQHYGGAMAFLDDGTLLVTTGDGFDQREQAQSLDSLLGKTIRIAADGGVPADNPFAAPRPGGEHGPVAAKVWSYGHRNPQGLAVDPVSGRIWQHEHGPRGGDELNLLRAGRNYGWPAITHGKDYSGAYVSPFTQLPDMQQPLMYWVPSIAPSGLTVYRGDLFPQWQGDLFVGALVDREVRRIDLEDGQIVGEQALFGELNERIRNVRTGPDGHLYLVTDSEQGRILRVDRPSADAIAEPPQIP